MPRSTSPPKSKSAFRQVSPGTGFIQRQTSMGKVSTPRSPSIPAVAPVPQTQTVTVEHKTGIWDSMKQGFGWGIGTSIARSMFTPTVSPITLPAPSSAVPVSTTTSQELIGQPTYNQCRKEGGDHEACKQYLS